MIQAIPTPLISSQQVPNSQTTLYTSPTNVTTIVDSITACNTSNSNTTVSLNIVPLGGAAGNSNLLLKAFAVNSGVTAILLANFDGAQLPPIILNPGDFISAVAAAASAITIQASGRQCS